VWGFLVRVFIAKALRQKHISSFSVLSTRSPRLSKYFIKVKRSGSMSRAFRVLQFFLCPLWFSRYYSEGAKTAKNVQKFVLENSRVLRTNEKVTLASPDRVSERIFDWSTVLGPSHPCPSFVFYKLWILTSTFFSPGGKNWFFCRKI